MVRVFTFLLVMFSVGCSPMPMSELPDASVDEKIYSPCAVIQDYLTERRIVFKDGVVPVPEMVDTFHYVNPQPKWVGVKMGADKVADANTTRSALTKHLTFIHSRITVPLKQETIDAYYLAQDSDFVLVNCVMPPHIYTKLDGAERIEQRVKHNVEIFTRRSQAVRLYNEERVKTGAQYDASAIFAIREKFARKRLRYMHHKFSRVGVNRDGRQAIFYSEHYCGRLCAGGSYVVMELIGQTWKVQRISMVWIS